MSRAAPRRRAEPVRRRDRRAAQREDKREEHNGRSGGARRAASPTPPLAAPVEEPRPARATEPDPALLEDLDPPVRRTVALEGPAAPAAVEPAVSTQAPWWELTLWSVILVVGAAALAAGLVPTGPTWLPGAGALAVATTYTWVLAARSGGRPVTFTVLTLAVGAITLALDRDELRTGAAVVTAVIAAVLAVVITVPAVRFIDAARETCIAVGVAGLGALAALGFEPQVDVGRFEYATLALSLLCAFTLVYRLGAGLHGLGTRGLLIVIVGAVTLAVTLAYAEMLRRYGTPDLVTTLLDAVHWSRDNLGAFPRPIEAVLGVPALVWGTHMRARRRQGWWVCAFGVAGTAAISDALVNPAISVTECALSVLYGLVVGLLIGYVLIRIDLALTGAGGGRRAVGRTGRRAEEAEHAVRPEPKRTDALL
ncbi:hypothetical protein SAMN04487968_102368 [Nocardioides terrae]|uniref:Uncharacterized protein n=1 Tax=Nocardioides terrae TaxID=574651 RepID=A0A1I1F4B3_9ACTN|nr:hypothetical protein [Nocardioides terrae]SFB93782.1 hypothetical protein SAMN04487968_102368 [Nocardioides terrae]